MKNFFVLLFVLLLSGFAVSAQAQSNDPFNNLQPETIITTEKDFERLLLDFTLKNESGEDDYLHALTLKNQGSFTFQYIDKLEFWADENFEGFEGLTLDKKLGEFTWVQTINGWAIKDLNYKILKNSSKRFFVTASFKSLNGSDEDFKLRIHSKTDVNNNGAYDHGDYGIYFLNNSDFNYVVNQYNEVVIKDRNDFLGPYFASTNVESNIELGYGDEYVIYGVARDRVDSGLTNLQVRVDADGLQGVWEQGTIGSLDKDKMATWRYTLKDLEPNKQYTINVRMHDTRNNRTEVVYENIVFVRDQQNSQEQNEGETGDSFQENVTQVSLENSTLFVNRNLGVRAPFEDTDVYVKVRLKDKDGKPIEKKFVKIIATRPGKIIDMTLVTNQEGEAIWTVVSTIDAKFTFEVEVDNKKLLQKPTINFVTETLEGELIKGKSSDAVYLLRDGKRYVFPNESVYRSYYENFDLVKEVSDSELASYQLGENITYRVGSLVKSPSLASVYMVGLDGKLHEINNEADARLMYGPTWASQVHDVPDAFFVNYAIAEKYVTGL